MKTLVMHKLTVFFCLFGYSLAVTVEPYRHVVITPHSASESFYTGSEKQVLAPAPVVETPEAAPAAPVPAFAPAPSFGYGSFPSGGFSSAQFSAPAAVIGSAPFAAAAAPVAAVAPAPFAAGASFAATALPFSAPAAAVAPAPAAAVAPAPVAAAAPVPVAPVVAKVAQFKLSYPQYAYGYSVQDFTTGDNKVAKEVREGGVVKGSYSVADPDGTKRTVNYYADPVHGFNAVVHKTKIL